jgi:hypothetical protein
VKFHFHSPFFCLFLLVFAKDLFGNWTMPDLRGFLSQCKEAKTPRTFIPFRVQNGRINAGNFLLGEEDFVPRPGGTQAKFRRSIAENLQV